MPAKSDSLLANSICTEINEWLLNIIILKIVF